MTVFVVPVDVDDQLILDILTTAIEGGSNYWIESCNLDRNDSDLSVTKAEINTHDGEMFIADKNTIISGIKMMLNSDSNFMIGIALNIILHEDYDACDADNILQYGMFKELVYS